MERYDTLYNVRSRASANEMQTVLITGGSEGMGLSSATMLSAKGANIIIVSRNAAKLQTALKQIQA